MLNDSEKLAHLLEMYDILKVGHYYYEDIADMGKIAIELFEELETLYEQAPSYLLRSDLYHSKVAKDTFRDIHESYTAKKLYGE